MLERLRVQHALLAANVKTSRFERFKECGGDCVIEWSPSRQRHRLRANYCGDRFCIPCCNARAARVRARLEKLIGNDSPLVMEFTIRNDHPTLAAALNHLFRSFVRLRESKIWRDNVRAGVAVVEVKRGQGSGEWHPHLHVIALGSYMPQKGLSDAWRKSTGGSPVVWIKRVDAPAGAVRYVTKYATKGWTAEVTRDHDSLVECILALRGRRLLCTFGTWYRLKLDSDSGGEPDWKRIGRLDHVYRAWLRGEAWAIGVMVNLGWAPEEKRNKRLSSGGADVRAGP